MRRPCLAAAATTAATEAAYWSRAGSAITYRRLRHARGEETNLHFEYIRVERYQTAISLEGDRGSESASNGSNRIYGCYFQNIGNAYNPGVEPSTAARSPRKLRHNVISNNHFVEVINATAGGRLHAVYNAHMSDRNQILRNHFENNTGDPVRNRDFSNDNVIKGNRFIKTGLAAGYTDWYCDKDIEPNCTKRGPECPSWNNQFRDNLLDGDYACQSLPTFVYFQDASAPSCSPPSATAVTERRTVASRDAGVPSTRRPCPLRATAPNADDDDACESMGGGEVGDEDEIA